jgi:hypothetical protein
MSLRNKTKVPVSSLVVALLFAALPGCDHTQDDARAPAAAASPRADLGNLKSADGTSAHVRESADLDDALSSAKVSDLKSAADSEYHVKGDTLFDSWYLRADKIVFDPGARLVFSRAALAQRRDVWVVTRELVSDPASPGVISWEKDLPLSRAAANGEAPAGANGAADGGAGAPGQTGAKGDTGAIGENGPQLTLVVLQVTGGEVLVDFSGGTGGTGGQGMKGGSGGSGGIGESASQSASGCSREAGDGGAGGRGGAGGKGGDGGQGGTGGTIALFSKAESLSTLTPRFRLNISGGPGGAGGAAGVGGDGGSGGAGGARQLPRCKNSGRNGAAGLTGPSGAPGRIGTSGEPGDFAVGALTDLQVKTFLPPTDKKSK